MAPIAAERSTGPAGSSTSRPDPLRRTVHVALALYLMPVVAIVCAIGGAAMIFDRAARVVGRSALANPRAARTDRMPDVHSGRLELRPHHARDRRRVRV